MPWKNAEQIVRQPFFSASVMWGSVKRRGVDFALHQRIETIARAVRRPAQLDHFARQEAFQHVQRDIMRAEIERHADQCCWRAAAAYRPANPARTTMAE